MSNPLVQYVLVVGDLIRVSKWPLGAIVAQACHASVAVTHLFYDDEHTRQYLQDLDRMHKVVLEVPNEEELRKLEETLITNKIDHKLWIEQPENIPTCIAIKPYPKTQVHKYVRKYKLLSL